MRPAWGHRRSDLWYQRGRDCAGIYKQGRRHILDEILSCKWVLLEVVQKGRLPRHRDVHSIQQQTAFRELNVAYNESRSSTYSHSP